MTGFRAGDLSSEAYQQRRLMLQRLGRIWKDQQRGSTNLVDMWPQLYRGGGG
jgi:hypothetical protein